MASATKRALKGVNLLSYTSAFESLPQAPSDDEIEKVKSMMDELKCSVGDVKTLYEELKTFLPIRQKTLRLVSEAIVDLNLRHRKVNIAKVSGSSVSLVGDGLIIGGAIAAPFTLGFSLIATAVGGAVCAAGGVTSAGAGIAELIISKKKVKQIQKVIDEDSEHSKRINELWTKIMGNCESVSKKHSSSGSAYSPEDIVSVLMVCCINKIPEKILKKAPKGLLEKVNGRASKQPRGPTFDDSAAHATDVAVGVGSGAKSVAIAGRATAGVVLSALVVKFAEKGSTAVCHCAKLGGVSRKIVTTAKVFRIATGINPGISIAFSAVGSAIDIA